MGAAADVVKDILKKAFTQRSFLTYRNLENFYFGIRAETAVDALCGYDLMVGLPACECRQPMCISYSA